MADCVASPTVWDVRKGLDESFAGLVELSQDAEVVSDPKVSLAVRAEMRQHFSLAERSVRSLSRADSIKAFQDMVMEAMRQETPGAYERLAQKIHEMGTDK